MTTASPEEITRLASRYTVVIQWSSEDGTYVVRLPEWGEFCPTHGATREKALKDAQEVLEALVKTDLQDGQPLPKPDVYVYVFKHDSDTSATAEGDGT